MNGMRKWFGLLVAVVIAALAAPAWADTKVFSFVANGGNAIPGGSGKVFDVSFTNRDDGNSTFNSAAVQGNGSGLIFRNARVKSGSNKAGIISGVNTNKITVTDLSPVKSPSKGGAPLVIEVTVDTTAACGNGSVTWIPDTWTGSPSSPSNLFTRPSPLPTSVVASACDLLVLTPPTDAVINQRITGTANTPGAAPVQVQLVGADVAGKWVDLTQESCTSSPSKNLALTGAAAQANGSGIATFTTLESSTDASGCVLRATRRDVASLYKTTPATSFKVVNATAVFSPLLTSINTETGTNVVVKLVVVGSSPQEVIPQTGSGTIAVVGPCTVDSASAMLTSPGVLTFTGLKGNAGAEGKTCSISVTGFFGDGTYGTEISLTIPSLTVYEGPLSCPIPYNSNPQYSNWGAEALKAWEFDGSPFTNNISDVAFFKGIRGANKNSPCLEVNYTLLNNIMNDTEDGTSIFGKIIPPNGMAFFWDESLQPDATFKAIVTYQDEWASNNGWLARRTKACVKLADGKPANDCKSDNGNIAIKLKACLGTHLVQATMPKYDASDVVAGLAGTLADAVFMPACVVSESWSTVPEGLCTADLPQPPNSACIRTTTELIMIQDPITIRD